MIITSFRLRVSVGAAFCLAALLSCSDASGPPAVASLSVAITHTRVAVGGSTNVVATARDKRGQPVPGTAISWTSSDPTIATVSATGLVEALSTGSATITASAGSVQGTVAVTVGLGTCTADMAGTIASGEVLTGALAQADCVLQLSGQSEGYADGYVLVLDDPGTLRIDVTTSAFDGLLYVTRPDMGSVGHGTETRFIGTLEAGTYIVWVRSRTSWRTGAYELRLATQCRPDLAEDGIEPGETVDGALTESNCVAAGSGSWADAYAFTLDSTTTMRIDLSSVMYDVALRVSTPDAVMLHWGLGFDANDRILEDLGAGTYIVWASAASPDALGDYRLTVSEAPPPCSPDNLTGYIDLGETRSAMSYAGECVDDTTGSRVVMHGWQFSVPEFSPVSITLTDVPFAGSVVIADEEGTLITDAHQEGTGVNALHTLPAGRYHVWTGIRMSVGAYSLNVETVEVPPCTRGAIELGQTVTGSVSATACPVMNGNTNEDGVFLRLGLPEQRTIHVNLEEIVGGNPKLQVMDEGGIVLATDYSDLSTYTRELPAGAYTLWATGVDARGEYRISVLDDAQVPLYMDLVTPSENLEIGGTIQMSAVPRYADGAPVPDRTVTWSSSRPDIATVDSTGLVSGVSWGAVVISASSRGESGSIGLGVRPPPCTGATSGTIMLGDTVAAALIGTDCAGPPIWQSFAHGYSLALAASTMIHVDVTSSAFEPSLRITDLQLNHVSNADVSILDPGEYIIWVSGSEGALGAYQLAVVEAPAACSADLAANTIAPGQWVSGEVSTSDCLFDGTTRYADGYGFVLGQSTDILLQVAGTGFEVIVTTTDMEQVAFGGDTELGTRFVGNLPAGTYIAWLTHPYSTGPYDMLLAELPPRCNAASILGSVDVGASVSGNLQSDLCELLGMGGANSQGWTVTVSDLSPVQIEMTSDSMSHTVLSVTDTAMNVLVWRHHSGPDQFYSHTFAPGTYIVWAGAFPLAPPGDVTYQLALTPLTLTNCSIRPIQPGDVVNGVLGEEDCPAMGGRRAAVHELTLAAAATVEIELTSNTFNDLYVMNGRGLVVGVGDNTHDQYHSQLVLALPPGSYTIWSVAGWPTGTYELSVQVAGGGGP